MSIVIFIKIYNNELDFAHIIRRVIDIYHKLNKK
jgi:hypothetical protein